MFHPDNSDAEWPGEEIAEGQKPDCAFFRTSNSGSGFAYGRSRII